MIRSIVYMELLLGHTKLCHLISLFTCKTRSVVADQNLLIQKINITAYLTIV